MAVPYWPCIRDINPAIQLRVLNEFVKDDRTIVSSMGAVGKICAQKVVSFRYSKRS